MGGTLLFLVVGTIVGIRLCLLAKRTRQVPELAIGSALLFGGSIALLLAVAGFALQQQGSDHAAPLLGSAMFSLGLGSTSLAIFNWHVFHRSEPWVRNAVVGVAAALLVLFVAEGLTGHFRIRMHSMSPFFASTQAIRCSLLLWSVYEALRYWRMMRRRVALGLADRLVTNRMALWGVGMLGALVGNLFTIYSFARGATVIQVGSAANLVPAAAGMTAALCLFFGFMPPAFYRRWLEGHTTAA
jgi:hypothetical protein